MAEGGTSDSLSDLLDKLIVNWEEVIQSTSQQTLCEYKKLSEELSSYLTRDCLTKLAKVLQNLKPMTLVDYVHSKLQNLAKDQPEADADVWQYGKTFSQVKQIMDSTLAVPSSAVTETDASDETAEHIIKWSLELWLLSRFQCESESGPVKTWTLLQGCRIFKKYIKEDMPGGERKRFYVLVENDCKDLVEQLFKHELAGEKFEEHLKDRREVMKLSELDISTDMVKIVSEKSHTYYIIPKNNENNKMYGAFVYLMRTENQTEPIISLHGGKAEEMRDLMKNAGFNQFLDFLPFTWTFPKLLSDLKQKLSEINCTMLFLSFFTHGCNGYISDTMNGFIKVEEILEIMNSSPELKRIPKILFIQSCNQNREDTFTAYKRSGDGTYPDEPTEELTGKDTEKIDEHYIQRRVNNLTENTMLITTSKPGNVCRTDYKAFKSFMQRFKARLEKKVSGEDSGQETAQDVFDFTAKQHIEVCAENIKGGMSKKNEFTPLKTETDGEIKGIMIPKTTNQAE